MFREIRATTGKAVIPGFFRLIQHSVALQPKEEKKRERGRERKIRMARHKKKYTSIEMCLHVAISWSVTMEDVTKDRQRIVRDIDKAYPRWGASMYFNVIRLTTPARSKKWHNRLFLPNRFQRTIDPLTVMVIIDQTQIRFVEIARVFY